LATNLIAEVIPGYMLEGSILGNMVSGSFFDASLEHLG
jgi:hypothetical protein